MNSDVKEHCVDWNEVVLKLFKESWLVSEFLFSLNLPITIKSVAKYMLNILKQYSFRLTKSFRENLMYIKDKLDV